MSYILFPLFILAVIGLATIVVEAVFYDYNTEYDMWNEEDL